MASKKTPDLRLNPTSDDTLGEIAAIQPADIARAQGAWEAKAPVPYRTLLDAVNDPVKRK